MVFRFIRRDFVTTIGDTLSEKLTQASKVQNQDSLFSGMTFLWKEER